MILPVEMAVMSTTVMHLAVGFWGGWVVVAGFCWLVFFVVVGLLFWGLVFFQRTQQWKIPYLLHASRSLRRKRKLLKLFNPDFMAFKFHPHPHLQLLMLQKLPHRDTRSVQTHYRSCHKALKDRNVHVSRDTATLKKLFILSWCRDCWSALRLKRWITLFLGFFFPPDFLTMILWLWAMYSVSFHEGNIQQIHTVKHLKKL